MNITAKRAGELVSRLREFKRETLKEEDEQEYRCWVEGLIDAAILIMERIAK